MTLASEPGMHGENVFEAQVGRVIWSRSQSDPYRQHAHSTSRKLRHNPSDVCRICEKAQMN